MDDKLKILIVEDEVIIAMRFEVFFMRRGYQVVNIVSSGEAAVKSAQKDQPDLILMDINLKGMMSGIEAATIISAEQKIPIMFMTGYSDENLRMEADKVNPIAYFMKPIDMNEVLEAIKILIDNK
ncbi:MAG: response regulator [Candidatus Stygibacter frigidus]|nr:response regulator [Candidatus Stygibacter frigidus]